MILKGSEAIGIPEAERQTDMSVTIPVYLGMSSYVLPASEVIFAAVPIRRNFPLAGEHRKQMGLPMFGGISLGHMSERKEEKKSGIVR